MDLFLQSEVLSKGDYLESISNLFYSGCSYQELLEFLSSNFGKSLSLRKLHRYLRVLNLCRKKKDVDIQHVIEVTVRELAENPSDFGYRSLHQKLMTMRIPVHRDTVRQILRHADPEGVECRSKKVSKRRKYYAKGPYGIWHIDGNDKVKPYGFEINGCIDGYSRKVFWMKIAYSNKDRRTVIYYYLVTVKNDNGFLCRVRANKAWRIQL